MLDYIGIVEKLTNGCSLLSIENLEKEYNISNTKLKKIIIQAQEYLPNEVAKIFIEGDSVGIVVLSLDNTTKWILEQKNSRYSGYLFKNPKDRIKYILKNMLLEMKFDSAEKYSEIMLVSKQSILRDFKKIDSIIEPYGLTFNRNANTKQSITGRELMINKFIERFLFNDKDIQEKYNEDLIMFEKTIIEFLNIEQRKLSLRKIKKMANYLKILELRSNQLSSVELYSMEKCIIELSPEKDFVEKILEYLQENINYCHTENRKYVLLLVFFNSTAFHGDPKTILDIKGFREDVLRTIGTIENEFQFNFKLDDDTIDNLSLHVFQSIRRKMFNVEEEINIDTKLINTSLISQASARLFYQLLNYNIKSDFSSVEIKLLSMYFELGINKNGKKIKNILVVCNSGMATSHIIKKHLKEMYGAEVEIKSSSSELILENLADIDLIISTVPISDEIDIAKIYIDDIYDCFTDNKFHDNKHEKMTIVDNLLFEVDDIYVFTEENEHGLNNVLNQLVNDEKITLLEKKSFLDREALSTSYLGRGILLPHITTKAKKNKLFVFRNEKFDKKKKNSLKYIFVILFSEVQADETFIINFFDNLQYFILNDKLQKMISTQTDNEILYYIIKREIFNG